MTFERDFSSLRSDRYDRDSSNTGERRFSRDQRRDTSSYDNSSYGNSSYGASRGFGGQSFGGQSFGGSSFGASGGFNSLGGNLRDVDWSRMTDLSSIKKDFYVEHPEVASLSAEQVVAFRNKHMMKVKGDAPNPITRFDLANFPDYVMRKFTEAGFSEPSPIQAQGWPIALSGKDTIGIAQTGSGKTLSFLLPGLIHINAQPPIQRGDGPIVLVLAPTRELVQQIEAEAKKFCPRTRSCSLVGGMPKGPQIRQMREGCEMVVATPGRLIDLMDMGIFNLQRVSYLALDEADRMLDMGFEKPLRQICGQIRADRQTLFWSATWPKEVERLACDLCQNAPVHLTVGSVDLKANERVTQHIDMVNTSHDRKIAKCKELFLARMQEPEAKSIVFCKTKRGCDDVARQLKREGYGANAIHGDKEQRERDWVLNEFKAGRCPILVATDVAARGLDVKGVVMVVNWDFPLCIEDYVHRIGRTGRAGAYGESYTFFVERDLPNAGKTAKDLIKILNEANQAIPHELADIAMSSRGGKGGKGKGKGGNRFGGFGGSSFGGFGGSSFGGSSGGFSQFDRFGSRPGAGNGGW